MRYQPIENYGVIGGTVLRLRSSVPLRLENGAASAESRLRAGETAAFILEEAQPDAGSPSAAPDYISESFKETMNFWQRWIAKSRYRGRWREMIDRSAITLKLLAYALSGSCAEPRRVAD